MARGAQDSQHSAAPAPAVWVDLRLRRIDRLETGPEPVRLAPGSDHLMIFGLSESARTNAAARLTLTFESGLVAEEPVFPIEDAMPE